MPRRFRIHPSIGVARVGDAPDAFFIGPEQPGRPANLEGEIFKSFRDDAGRIMRQAARFHVFEYFEDDSEGRLSSPKEVEINPTDVVDIEWRVHLANKKASFFTFNGKSGASDVYEARSGRPANDQEKSDPDKTNRRNANVPEADRRQQLEIDPGEKLISKANGNPVPLTNPNTAIPISDLGELRLDDAGRLLVLGGHGKSASTEIPPRKIDEYANNDTWFDDVSDGSVKARVRFKDGSSVDADAAWVLVGPPKFVPEVRHVVTLYDTLWDIAVQNLDIPANNALFATEPLRNLVEQKQRWTQSGGQSLAGYRPSFVQEIYPILQRAFSARDLHDPGEMYHTYHLQLIEWDRLSAPDSGNPQDDGRDARSLIFSWIRNPDSNQVDWRRMPRGLGDDNFIEEQAVPTSFLSLTRIQYAVLTEWAKGNFQSDWPGVEPGIPPASELTPEDLDCAALENSVGGPFFPGIEVSWLIRRPELYAEPFRLKVLSAPDSESQLPPLKIGSLEFGPGFFTQQMALPWQADFYDCHKERIEQPETEEFRYYMWWTAQRPDDVYTAGATEQVRWVRAFDPAATTEDPDNLENLERFNQMQQNWAKLRFIVTKNGRLEEEA